MPRELPSSSDRHDNLDSILADYMRRLDAGEQIDEEAFVAAHPDLADELRAYFSHAGVFHRVAADITADFADHTTARGVVTVRCPTCHAPMKVAADTALTDLTCSACGTQFSLVNRRKATRIGPSLLRLGRFELVERIGVGGFGTVWKARDVELDRTVAVKIPRQGGMTPEEQEKFFREARAAAQLRHPNIVSIHEVGRDSDSIYIVSDFVRGTTLGDWLSREQLTSREAAELCAKIADALHHAHEQGVVHRDLKPANIMIDSDGEPHLMDFGLARREVGEVTMTLDGQVLGTPAYMSPEQAQGEAHTADRRSDVYSLGVILFQLLTRELPFRGNVRMLIHQVIHDDPPSPRKLDSNVPKDLETITLKCLRKEPSQRYKTAQEVADELRRWLAGKAVLARPVTRMEQAWRWARRNRTLALLASSVVLLLVAVAVLSTFGYAISRRQKIEAQQAAARESALFQEAFQAVEDFFTLISQTRLFDRSGLQPLRLELLELALKEYRDFAAKASTDPDVLSHLAAAYFRVGLISSEIGDRNAAAAHIQEAVKIWERLVKELPHSQELIANLASAYFNLAALRDDPAETKNAIDLYVKARDIWQQLLAGHEKSMEYRFSLAQTLDQIANLQQQTGELDQALQTYEAAREQYRLLIDQSPEWLMARRQLGVHWHNVARLRLRLGDQQAARECLEKSRDILEACARSEPGGLSSRRSLAAAYCELGTLIAGSGDLDEGLRLLTKARDLQSELVVDNPAIADIQVELAHTLVGLAAFESKRPRPDGAPARLIEARDLLPELAGKSQWEPGSMRLIAAAHYRDGLRTRLRSLDTTDRTVAVNLAQLAFVQAAGDNPKGYATTCKELRRIFGDTRDGKLAGVIAWTCSLRPEGAQHPSELIGLAKKSLADDPQDRAMLYALGAAHYRAGAYDLALEAFRTATGVSDSDPDAADQLFVAMIHFRSGRTAEARALLNAVEEQIAAQTVGDMADHSTENPISVANAIEQQIILAEAKRAMEAAGNN